MQWAKGLTALNLAIPIYSFIHGIGLMLGMGGATRYAILKSQGEKQRADRNFTNTIWLAAVSAALFMLAGIFLSGWITRLMGADAEVFAMTDTYLRVLLLFSPAFVMNEVLVCFVRNDGSPKLSMAGMVVGSLSNIFMDYILIFPMELGILGAVLATGTAPVISMGILSLHFFKKKNQFHFVKGKLEMGMAQQALALGVPSLVSEVSTGIVMIIFNGIILGLRGNVGVAAYGIIANLSLVIVAIYTGVAQGMQPLVSRAYGKNERKGERSLLRYAMVAVAGISCAAYAGVLFGADFIVRVFNSEGNKELQGIANVGMRIYFMGVFFMGVNIVLAVYFTSREKVAPAYVISLLRGIVAIVPVAFLLSSLWGMAGVWMAAPVTEGMVAVFGIASGLLELLRKK